MCAMTTTTSIELSTTCQHIISSTFSSPQETHVLIRSCMGDPSLAPTILDHKCNGTVLTPAGLYASMATDVTKHIWHRYRGPDAELPGLNIFGLEVHKPTIIKDPSKITDHWLEMETTATLSPEQSHNDVSNLILKCAFHTITPTGTRLQENGHCTIKYEPYTTWLSQWSPLTPPILARIATLHVRATKENASTVQLVHRNTAYKMFQSFVHYTGKYQTMSEVVFDHETLEATSLLEFLPHPERDCTGPYYLDGSCHISGFVANAVEKDIGRNAFIANGVGAMKLSPRFDPAAEGAVLRNYVRMQTLANDKTVLCGDVFVLQDGEIVGVWEGVRFKKIPRRVLNVFLPPPPMKKK